MAMMKRAALCSFPENCWELDGEAEVDDVEHLLGSDLFENDDSETLNGFITNMLGRDSGAGRGDSAEVGRVAVHHSGRQPALH